MTEYSPYLQELIAISTGYPDLGKTEALRVFSEGDYNEGSPLGVRMSAKDHATLEQHIENPFLIREINLKKLSPSIDVCVAIFTDFQYEQMIICSTYECKHIVPISKEILENWDNWYGLVSDGKNPPKLSR